MTAQELDQSIYNTALQQGFTPTAAKFVVAQARFESADYKSSVFKNNNNTSGIKFIGQPNATRGSLSPEGNYYARFNTVQDSVNDKIARIYNITMRGVTPTQLKNSESVDDFARLLKQRGYFTDTLSNYTSGLKAKLLKVNVLEFVKKNAATLVVGLILLVGGSYLLYKKLKK